MPRIDRIQVHPAPAALATLNATTKGQVGSTLNLALEVFADLLAQATKENAPFFSRKEWTRIAVACTEPFTEPFKVSSTPIGARLRNCVARNGANPDADVRLATKLDDLDDLQAWAVVWSLRTYQTRGADLAKDEWWTLKFRTAKEGKGQR